MRDGASSVDTDRSFYFFPLPSSYAQSIELCGGDGGRTGNTKGDGKQEDASASNQNETNQLQRQ